MKKDYRLGIDLGSTSLGWCMLELDQNNDPTGIIKMGVRIFPDGREMKSKEPLSVQRRNARGQRRNLDRYLERARQLISYLLEHGFLPKNEKERAEVFQVNPYMLRAKALDQPLSPAEFARALIHLAKRRGFRSNRKALSDKKHAYSEAINNLNEALQGEGVRTLGEYMWNRYQQVPGGKQHRRQPIKFRYEKTYEDPIFPTRNMVEEEFDAIWSAQAAFNPAFSGQHKKALHHIIFFQRELLSPPKGKCQLIPEEPRAPKAHPLFQEFRIRQDLNNLRAINLFTNETQALSDAEYETLFDMLNQKAKVTFKAMRKKLWGKQAEDWRFNLETNERKELLGDQTRAVFHKKGNEALAALWEKWDLDTKNEVIEILISDLDDEPLLRELFELGVAPETATALMNLSLPDDYCHLSVEAMKRILPHMRKRMMYSDACKIEKFSHSGEYSGEIFDEGNLPYYGELLKRETIELNRETLDPDADEHGRINNPSVHIALNQLRKLVNALVKKYGVPHEIVLELGKDIKLGKKEKDAINRANFLNRKENEKIDDFLEQHGQRPSRLNRLKTKLWWELGEDELDRRCPYSGQQIALADLYTYKTQIDHILPKSLTYDDSNANKILCLAHANRYKKERSPWQAFGQSLDGYEWSGIVARANKLKPSKRWRFQADALQNFEDQEEVLARMLNDTRYMSRVAMKYMWHVSGNNRVWTVTGRHTSLLRGKWGLNTALGEEDAKNRADHRHHAIDAFVIALTTRSLIKNLASRIRESRERFIENLDPPWARFSHEDFRAKVNSIAVSIKPDHINPTLLAKRNQTGGALLKETAYGCAGPDPKNPKQMLYTLRRPVSELNPKNVENVVRLDLREELQEMAQTRSGADFAEAVQAWAQRKNIKKIKLALPKNPAGMVPILDKNGRPFKYMDTGENLFADIYLSDPTNPDCSWGIEIVDIHSAHQPGFLPQWKKDFPKGKRLMRLYKNDVIAIDAPDGSRELKKIRKMTGNIIYLRHLSVAKKPKGQEDIGEQYSPKQLKEKRVRKAGVDIIGRVFDPIVNEP